MKRVIPYIILCLLCFAGCQSESTKDDKIETKISNAIFKGQSAEEIKESEFEQFMSVIIGKVKLEKDIQPNWMSAFLMLAGEVDENAFY